MTIFHNATQPRVNRTWGTWREKLDLGSAWSFRKPREKLSPQAGYANVSKAKRYPK